MLESSKGCAFQLSASTYNFTVNHIIVICFLSFRFPSSDPETDGLHIVRPLKYYNHHCCIKLCQRMLC
uniref:Uncharacterized protein n=1 Tax=Arundo donax TaxID=35708 RepID=A0A0A8YZT5_ARUDO